MDSFRTTFSRFHGKTEPSDWLEGLLKAYVGDGLAADFYREIAAFLDPSTRELVVDTMSGTSHSDFVVEQVRAAIGADPRVAGRLALWGRRLMGEALSQAQTLVAERDALSAVMVGGAGSPGMDLTAIGRMFTIAANFTDPDAYFLGGGVTEAAPHFRDWFLAEVRAGTTLRAEQQSVVEFAIVADLDMAGARGSAFAALHAIRP